METKGTVSLEGLKFFAYHGVYDFEKEKGNTFWVDVYMSKTYSAKDENTLENTIDYEKVYVLIEEVMKQPEPLIETVAKKTIAAITNAFPMLESMRLKIKKNKPPIKGAKLNYSAFSLEWRKG